MSRIHDMTQNMFYLDAVELSCVAICFVVFVVVLVSAMASAFQGRDHYTRQGKHVILKWSIGYCLHTKA